MRLFEYDGDFDGTVTKPMRTWLNQFCRCQKGLMETLKIPPQQERECRFGKIGVYCYCDEHVYKHE